MAEQILTLKNEYELQQGEKQRQKNKKQEGEQQEAEQLKDILESEEKQGNIKKNDKTKVEKKLRKARATLSYPYDEKIADIFLTKKQEKTYIMEKDGVEIAPEYVRYSEKFRKMFGSLGYKFPAKTYEESVGKRKVFGIDIKVIKLWDDEGQKIEEISIDVRAQTLEEAKQNVDIIAAGVKKKMDIEPSKTEWKRMEAC
jgi:DNA gyrase/topoisomerase IV subunit A